MTGRWYGGEHVVVQEVPSDFDVQGVFGKPFSVAELAGVIEELVKG